MPLEGKTLRPQCARRQRTFPPITFHASCLLSMTLNAVGYVVDVATDHLATLFAQRAKQHPDREFLVFGSRRMSYRQIERDAVALAGALAGLGVQPGDRLAGGLPDWPEGGGAVLAPADL